MVPIIYFQNARKVKPLLKCSHTNFRGAHKSRTVLLECSFSKKAKCLNAHFLKLSHFMLFTVVIAF